MNEFFNLIDEQAPRLKGLAAIISKAPYGQWRIQVNWSNACKRGGDMIIAYAEEPYREEAFEAAFKRLKEWLNTHEEDINARIRNM